MRRCNWRMSIVWLCSLTVVCGLNSWSNEESARLSKPRILEIALDSPTSGPAIVGVDDDNTVWVALAKSGKLARLMNNKVSLFDLGRDSRPVGIAVGTNANGDPGVLWVAASYDNK